MTKTKKTLNAIRIASGLVFLCVLFQNCGPNFTVNELGGLSQSVSSVGPASGATCSVAGVKYEVGKVVSGYASYSVVSPANCGQQVKRTCLPSGQFDGSMPVYDTCTALTPQSNAIDALPPGEWMEIPNSHLRDVFAPVNPSLLGGPSGVVGAWSGGAFDTKRDRMIVWGGGHGDYYGNEIYVFDLNSLKWTRVNDPSFVEAGVAEFPSGYYTDGNPVSRHTYNYLQYLPDPIDRFCSFGGAGLWQSGQYGTSHVDCFNFDKNLWETQKFPDTPSAGIGANTAYDPVTQSLWQHGGYADTGMSRLDLKTGQWTQLWRPFTNAGYTLGYYRTSDLDPLLKQFIAVGANKIITWDLNNIGPTNYGTEITTTGPQNIVAASSPGFIYVPDLMAFVGWGGGKDLYKLDLATKTWTTMPLSANSAATPPAVQSNWGTFGRMRYSPKKKVIVLITGDSNNVLVYKVK